MTDLRGDAERLAAGGQCGVEAAERRLDLGLPPAQADEDRIDEARLAAGGHGRKQPRTGVVLVDGLLEPTHVPACDAHEEARIAARPQVGGVRPRRCFARELQRAGERSRNRGGDGDGLRLPDLHLRESRSCVETAGHASTRVASSPSRSTRFVEIRVDQSSR